MRAAAADLEFEEDETLQSVERIELLLRRVHEQGSGNEAWEDR